MSTATIPTTSKPRKRRRVVRFVLLFLASALIAFCIYEWVEIRRQEARLDIIVADLDRSDPGWRITDIEAARMAYPSEAKNSALQVLGLKALLPSRPWPKWPFPELEDQPERLKTAQETMEKRLWLDHAGPPSGLEERRRSRGVGGRGQGSGKGPPARRNCQRTLSAGVGSRHDFVLLPHADSANLASICSTMMACCVLRTRMWPGRFWMCERC